MKELGFIGCGHMGEAMVSGVLKSGYLTGSDILVHTGRPESLEALHQKYGIQTAQTNRDVARQANLLLLAVKPNMYAAVINEIRESIQEDSIIITIAPSYSIAAIRAAFGKPLKVVRAMPNTPLMVGCGMSGITFSDNITEAEKQSVHKLFNSSGTAIEVKEDLMSAVGSVSGSSPAFVYMLIEAMADTAVALGLSRKDSYLFAAKAVEGAAKMVLETGEHPGALKDAVCSPGGTTIEGVLALSANGFRGNIAEAMLRSADKFREMESAQK